MRGFIGWLLLVAILGAVAFVAAPFVARPIIAGAVRAAVPLGAGPVEVDVSVDTLALLRGSVDRIHVTGRDLEGTGSSIGRLDVSAEDVSIGDRTFASMRGSLEAVVLNRPDGLQLTLEEVTLTGAGSAVDVTARLGSDVVIGLASAALADAGLSVDEIEVTAGGLRLNLLGQQTDVGIGVADGAVVLTGSVAGESLVLFRPEPAEPWRITGVSMSATGMDFHAVLDLESALRAR